MNPAGGAPSLRRFQPRARRTDEPLTLPVAKPRGRNLETQPRPLPPPLRSKETACSAEAPFLDELPARRSMNQGWAAPLRSRCQLVSPIASNADPPPCPGLCRPGPASDALSPFATGGRARPRRFRELIAPGRTTPRAARRLLQSKRSASTTCESKEPRSCIHPASLRPPCEGTIRFTGSFRSGEAELSRVRGWNRLRLSPSSPAPLGALARVESFAPTRLARTPPVAGLGISMAGGANSIVRAHLAALSLSRNSSPSGRAFASSREGPPPAPFREERMRSAAPEVPFIAKPPLRGGPFVHTLSPACGVRA
jgi:hypothetical protein